MHGAGVCEGSPLYTAGKMSESQSLVMPAKKKKNDQPLTGNALIKETCRRIRLARGYWEAHNNAACRGEREKAMALYESLGREERDKVPQVLRVWLRYRSEKYFGPARTAPGTKPGRGGRRRG